MRKVKHGHRVEKVADIADLDRREGPNVAAQPFGIVVDGAPVRMRNMTAQSSRRSTRWTNNLKANRIITDREERHNGHGRRRVCIFLRPVAHRGTALRAGDVLGHRSKSTGTHWVSMAAIIPGGSMGDSQEACGRPLKGFWEHPKG